MDPKQSGRLLSKLIKKQCQEAMQSLHSVTPDHALYGKLVYKEACKRMSPDRAKEQARSAGWTIDSPHWLADASTAQRCMFEADSCEVMPDVYYQNVPRPTFARGTSSRSCDDVFREIVSGSWHGQTLMTTHRGEPPMADHWWQDTLQFATKPRR